MSDGNIENQAPTSMHKNIGETFLNQRKPTWGRKT